MLKGHQNRRVRRDLARRRKLSRAVLALSGFFALASHSSAYAQTIDFEDLTLGDTFLNGDVFTSNGVDILVDTFFFGDGTPFNGGFSEVENGGLAGGSGNELEVNNVNLDFMFDIELTNLDLLFGEFGGNLNIDINGDFFNFNIFQDIHGTVIGGVDVSVVNGFGGDMGSLTLTGSITSFAIGGQELWIDDVMYRPIPSPGAIALLGLFGLAGRRRRRG